MKRKPVIDGESSGTRLTSFTVRQAARSLNLHPETVRDFLRHGRICGFRVGNRWRIREDVLHALLTQGIPLLCDCRH